MPDLRRTGFKPLWARELPEEERRALLQDEPFAGSQPLVSPRIQTRILLSEGATGLSARTLSEAIELTQVIASYAGRDVVSGINPEFMDLRSLRPEVAQLSRLTFEPFEEGSFVLPARLAAEPVQVQEAQQLRTVSAEDVVVRFGEILTSVQSPAAAAQVSIGAIQAIEELGGILRREANAIEFSAFGALNQPLSSRTVDSSYLLQVKVVRNTRRPTEADQDEIEGRLTAIDIVRNTLQLDVDTPEKTRVRGRFLILFRQALIDCLGRRVRLRGQIERRGGQIQSLEVLSIEPLDT